MSKGRFDAPKTGRQSVKGNNPYAVKNKPQTRGGTYSAKQSGGAAGKSVAAKLWPILAAVAGVAVLAVGVLLFLKLSKGGPETGETQITTTEIRGMTRAELDQKASELDALLRGQDLVLTLTEHVEDPQDGTKAEPEEPIVLTLTPAESGAGLDLAKLKTDLDADTKGASKDNYVVDLRDYLTVNEDALRQVADGLAAEYGTEFLQTEIKEETEPAPTQPPKTDDEDEDGDKPQEPDRVLFITKGVTGRDITADPIFEALRAAYHDAIYSEDPASNLELNMEYNAEHPDAVDVDALLEQYYRAPVDATYDAATNTIIPGEYGYGFDAEAVKEQLEATEPGQELRVEIGAVEPEMTAEKLEATLFRDVLGKADTPHSAIWNRTNNLKLACAAIDGTVVLPGEVFSFNKVVGQRTEEKGYKEAIAYVSGGASRPEVGGGVCQVASSIYYAVLQADLKPVERENHMYLVSYVPYGMDAAIFWGHLDFKFENTSPYPIRIDASVSDGQVHITLVGTEWKDYTVELSYEILDTYPWEVVEKEVPNDGTYTNGEVISSPYTGYRIATYRTAYDKDGNVIETTQIAVDRYNKRDKVIAVVTNTTEPTEKPTEPKPTEPKPTEPKPTDPPPTEPTPTEPEPTEPPPTESENNGDEG